VPTNGIAPADIHQQLSRILASDPFQHSGVLSHFLKFVVNTTLDGKGQELKEYTIARNVLSKKADFNPQMDSIVRIHAGRLRRALKEYYEEAGRQDPVVISIPKGSYVPGFSLPGQLNAVESKQVSIEQKRQVKISVAVLPFTHIGADQHTGPFADALGDHISTELTRYSELSVISYYSCRNIISTLTDIREAGRLLDAQYILTGTVQSNETQLRIMAQLTDAENRQQVWADTYERIYSGAELFNIQNEISWAVVSQTAGSYGAITRHLSELPDEQKNGDLKSHNAIYWYYQFVNKISEEFFYKAESALTEALQRSPDYALGWAVLGEVWVGGFFQGYQSKIVEKQLERAVEFANTAIRIDRACQQAYQTLALANLFLHRRAGALKAIEDWALIKPDLAGIKGPMGFSLICCGEYERGFRMIDESIRLNPYYQWWLNAGIAFYHFKKEQYPDAIYWIERMNMPNIPWQLLLKASALAAMNQMDQAKETATQFFQQFPFLQNQLENYTAAFITDRDLVDGIKSNFEKAVTISGV